MKNNLTLSTKDYFLQISFGDEKLAYEILKEASRKLEEKAIEYFLKK